MNKTSIGFIGAGKMAEALIRAIIKGKITTDIIASDVHGSRLSYIKDSLNVKVTTNNKDILSSDIIFLAVKPQQIDGVLNEIKDTDKLVVSIAAGITLQHIESRLKKARIIRVMPNTPCLVGEMAAGFSLGKKVKDRDVKAVEGILNSAGRAYLLDEKMLDAVTALSGSGPAFIAYMAEGMIEAGIKEGLSKEIASELTMQTFKGTAKLLQETGMSPKELIEMVSSPGGTTVKGMEILISSNIKNILLKTIEAATKRAKELGKCK